VRYYVATDPAEYLESAPFAPTFTEASLEMNSRPVGTTGGGDCELLAMLGLNDVVLDEEHRIP